MPAPISPDSEVKVNFADLQLSGPILQAIESAGYVTATPIQARAIPHLLAGRDVLGMAQTGTGKTAAFAIPLLQAIDLGQNVPQVLVLTPTRELAIQVADSFKRYASGLKGLKVVPIYGGQDYGTQFRYLDRGVHVVVGTPGRVMDHIRRGSLKLDSLRAIVLDEADEMLRMGFAEDVDWILTQSPAQRQIALFSATMPDAIRRIAQRHLRNPAEVTIRQATSTAVTVKQRFVVAAPHQKQNVLGRLLEAEPIDAVLIFVNTKSLTEPLAEYLGSQGHRTAALSSDVAQNQRERIVENLRAGKIDVIIATDVAARGLDVQRISHVINYDFPTDSENYVHRIGRTGRAGRSGHAILFSHPRGRHLMKRLEQATRQSIEPMDIPSADAINASRIAKFHQKITDALAHPELETFASLIEQYRANNDVPAEMVAAAMAVLASGEAPLLLIDEPNENDFPNFRDGGGSRQNGRERSNDNDQRGRSSDRGERGPVGRRGRSSGPMETFRIEVGLAHQVKATNIVGAIANETGLDSSIIGKIEIFDEHSTVDLLAGMPRQVFDALRNIKIAGRRLNITRAGEEPDLETGIVMADHDRDTPRGAKPASAAGKPRAEAKPFSPTERKGRSLVKKFKAKPKSKRATAKS